MKSKITVRQMTGVAIIAALVIILGLLSTYMSKIFSTTVSFNLALIPIVVGACIYGPWWGLFLGLIDGVICIVDPGTLATFFPFLPFATIVLCLLKTGIAGMVSGFIYKALHNKNEWVAIILASLIVPMCNTGIFLGGVYAFFIPLYQTWTPEGANVLTYVLVLTFTVNFAIEFAVAVLLSPAVYKIVRIGTRGKDIGSVYDKPKTAND